MIDNGDDIISYGKYVVFHKKEYKKLHLLSEKNECVFIGKDKIELDVIFGEKIGSVFKMIPKARLNRQFGLQLCSVNDISSAKESIKELGKFSGLDNRSICDDSSSQTLTSNSIEELRDSGVTPKTIIEQLVENSKTFHIKTEYSQEKYIKKKEKKYFEFITVRQPTIRVLTEIFSSRDMTKSVGIRIDTLSQIPTTLNFQPDGNYLVVESGFNGIVAATLLNCLSDEGKLVHMTPGNQNQKQAVLAMNFSSSRMSQLMTVRLSTAMGFIRETTELTQNSSDLNSNSEYSSKMGIPDNLTDTHNAKNDSSLPMHKVSIVDNGLKKDIDNEPKVCSSSPELRKRKYSNCASKSPETSGSLKKPRWAVEAELAVEVLCKKVDGLVVACKEFPLTIVNNLLEYVLPTRPFVIYSLYQEPLLALYLKLKLRHDIVYLRITETWLRPYQVLPERTHPAVSMSSSSGFLLSGIKVVNR